MASHIATEEWQSFELRMRRRRAERLVVRAEAALENGCIEDAGNALEEARRLCPSLPSLDDVQAKAARAAASSQQTAAAARVRRGMAIAAGLIIVAGSGAVGWRTARNQSAVAAEHAASPAATVAAPVAATPAATPSPVTPPPPPSIKVETRQVPPVVISGATEDEGEHADPPAMPAPRTLSASATTAAPPVAALNPSARVVGTSGPTTTTPPQLDSPPPSTADVGAIAALGNETSIPAPESFVDRVARLKESSNATSAGATPGATDSRTETAPAAASPAATIPAPKNADEAALVRSILDRYADAYTRLDADAAKAVWPSVNRAALSRAFNGLNEQRIAFNDCSVNVRSTEARATCSGSTTWEPKIGGGPHTDVRRWAFDLEKSADGWIIRDARVQNR